MTKRERKKSTQMPPQNEKKKYRKAKNKKVQKVMAKKTAGRMNALSRSSRKADDRAVKRTCSPHSLR